MPDLVTTTLETLALPGMTPGEIETFYRTAHAALGCTRDPHNG